MNFEVPCATAPMRSHPAKVGALRKTIDSQWIWTYHGQEWPVVLCGDELAPPPFIAGRKHDEEVAAILLGRRKFIWVLETGLKEYEPNKDYLGALPRHQIVEVTRDDDEVTKMGKQRRIAFAQDVTEFQTAAYWKNLIEQQREARVLAREMSVSSDGRKKRKRTDSDSPGRQGQLPTPRSTPRKTSKIAPIDTPSNEEPLVNRDILDYEEQRRLRRQNERLVIENPSSAGTSTIFVGTTKTPFRISTSRISASRVMKDRLTSNDMFRSHVDLSDIEGLTDQNFDAVIDHLSHGEFAPRLKADANPPHLEDVVDTEEKHEAALRCAANFSNASHLQLADLQMLCLDKLKTLYPLDMETLLFVTFTCLQADSWECEAESEYHEWIVDHIAEYYGKLKREWPQQLGAIFERSRALAKEVREKLASNPGMGHCGLSDDGEEK